MKTILNRLVPAALTAALSLSLLFAAAPALAADEDEQTDAAVAVLKLMESGDPDEVVETIRQQQKENLEAEREALRDQLLNGEIDVWSQFRDYVILGDSRAYGYSYNGFLPDERVLADVGDTLLDIEKQLPEIIALHPARVYVSYGANEFDMPELWPTGEEYAGDLAEQLERIEEALPGVEIYVNSFMKVQEEGQYEGGHWADMDDWNVATRQMCEEHGYAFIDNDRITEEHRDLYIYDGVHFEPEFYDYWAANMILATYYFGVEEPAE